MSLAGRPRTMLLIDEPFMFLMRLRQAFAEKDLGELFHIKECFKKNNNMDQPFIFITYISPNLDTKERKLSNQCPLVLRGSIQQQG